MRNTSRPKYVSHFIHLCSQSIWNSLTFLFILPALLGFLLIFLDVIFPTIRSIELFFIPLLFISLLFQKRFAPFVFATILSIFAYFEYFLFLTDPNTQLSNFVDTTVYILIIWVTAFLLWQIKEYHQQLSDITDHLDDLVSSKTQKLQQEIEHRKSIEQELNEYQTQLNLMMETIQLGVWEWDITHNQIQWDNTMYAIFNIPPSTKITYQDYEQHIHPDDLAMVKHAVQISLKYNQALSIEHRIVLSNQTVRYLIVKGMVVQNEPNQHQRFYGICLDNTEQVAIQEALKISEAMYRQAIDYAPFPAIIHAEDGEVLLVNQSWIETTGYAQDEIPTLQHWIEKAYPNDFKKMEEIVANINYKTGTIHEGSFKIITKNNTSKIWTFYSSPLKPLEDGRQVLITMASDVTDTTTTRNKLKANNLDLEKIVQARTQELESFSYSVSHDLRAPLRHISGFIQLLEREMSDIQNERANHFINIIKESANKLGVLIDELLTFSRMGRKELSLVETDVNEIIHAIIAESETEWSERNVRWEVDPLPTVKADPVLLRSVFYNLISNALKYSQKVNQPIIQIHATIKQSMIEFSIKDNGVGFDMKYANKLFQVFQRLHSADEYEGTGIGLATVKKIIQRHGGDCWAASEPNQGAEFYFTLPLGE